MEVHELGDVFHHLRGEPQCRHALARQPRPHDFVVVERRAATLERTRLRLPDVVQQRGEADQELRPRLLHHRDRVREHVFVVVHRILLELHRVELREELVGQLRAHQEPQTRTGIVEHEELRELVADPLRAHDLEPVPMLANGLHELRVRLEVEARDETRGAHHAQRVVGERDLRREGRPQPARGEVGGSGKRVDQLRRRAARAPSR